MCRCNDLKWQCMPFTFISLIPWDVTNWELYICVHWWREANGIEKDICSNHDLFWIECSSPPRAWLLVRFNPKHRALLGHNDVLLRPVFSDLALARLQHAYFFVTAFWIQQWISLTHAIFKITEPMNQILQTRQIITVLITQI